MRTVLLAFVLSLFLWACRSKSIPEGVLPPQQMKEVMWDFLRADQFLADQVFSRDTGVNKYIESVKWYGQILALHKISQDEFRRSFDYYTNKRPDLMEQLMDSIATHPDQMIKRTPVRKLDSLSN